MKRKTDSLPTLNTANETFVKNYLNLNVDLTVFGFFVCFLPLLFPFNFWFGVSLRDVVSVFVVLDKLITSSFMYGNQTKQQHQKCFQSAHFERMDGTYIFIARIIYQNVCTFWIVVDNMNVAHFKMCARPTRYKFSSKKNNLVFLCSIHKQAENTQSINTTGSRVFTLTYFDNSFDSCLNRWFVRFFIFMLATFLRLRFINRSIEIRYFHKIDARHSPQWMNEWDY